jgi:hypothetical protein
LTQDEIIEMARQAGFNVSGDLILDDMGYVTITNRLEAFAKLVAAKEREACAKECEHTALRMGSEWMAAHCAEAIRARGEA